MTRGGRNLIILGLTATIIAVATTSVSLIIYHNSGDIYLDRSRPGYLPDEEEIEQEEDAPEEAYQLEKTGAITREVLEEYLEHLEAEAQALDAYEDPFGPDVLSDSHLGIPAAE